MTDLQVVRAASCDSTRRIGLRPSWLAVMIAIANSSNATAIIPKHAVINATHPAKADRMHTIYHSDTEALTVETISSPFGTHALISDPVGWCRVVGDAPNRETVCGAVGSL